MRSYDNSGKLIAELNQFRSSDGKSVTTNTQYDGSSGRVNIIYRRADGNVGWIDPPAVKAPD